MKCSLCGFEFQEGDARKGCGSCGLIKNCGLIRCPLCNFEMALEPQWIKKLKKFGRKKDAIVR